MNRLPHLYVPFSNMVIKLGSELHYIKLIDLPGFLIRQADLHVVQYGIYASS